MAQAAALASPLSASVDVLVVARVWGSAWGFPNPWLMPSRRELDACRAQVAAAIEALSGHGIAASGRVVGTRDAARRIVRETLAGRHDAVVMGADPPGRAFFADLFWHHEPYRVQRRATVPVHLVLSS